MRLTALGVVLLAVMAEGAPRTLVVGAGDCQNVELASGVDEFGAALRDRLKADLYEPDVVLDIVRPRPTRSLEDVERQVESARTLFYNGQLERSLDLLKQAVVELERAPVTGQPWKVATKAFVLQGVVALSLGKKPDALESFRRVLRVEPGHALSGDDFAPSVISQFEAVRRELARQKKTLVQIQSARAGDDVLIDGRVMGATPLKLELAAGTYRVLLRNKARVSFMRTLTTPRDTQVSVDLGVEGALAVQPPLCLDAQDKGAEAAALRLANTVTADDLVLVRVDGPGGPLVASRYEIRTGSILREGRVQRSKQALSALATFLITGQSSSVLLTPEQAEKAKHLATEPTPPVEPAKKVEVAKVEPKVEVTKVEPKPEVAKVEKPVLREDPPMVTSTSAARFVAYGFGGLGVVAAAVGFGLFASGSADRTSLDRLKQADGKLPDPSTSAHRDALDLISRTDFNRTVSLSLIGVGAGLLASGVLTFVLFPGETTVSVSPSSSGGAIFFSGQF